MIIRETTIDDVESIRNVHLQAFDKSEAQIVSELAVSLLNENHPVKTLSLVAVENNEIVGHVAFSPVFIESSNEHFAYILAPLAVSPKHQKQQIGTSLVKKGLDSLSKTGSYIVFVYGDPQYYSRFGFSTELANNFTPPCTLQYPQGWQALKLGSRVLPGKEKITCVDPLNDPELW